jgi:PST family polysaccharide transporter
LVSELFGWQLVGDTIKIASFLLGYVYVAKGYVTLYVLSEILFSFGFFLLVVVMEGYFDLKGVAMAYALNYILHLIFVFFSLKFKKILL